MWRKRNARPGPRPHGGRRLASACLLAGIVLTPAALVLRELNRAEGVLTGEGLLVIRAAEDLVVEWLRDDDAVAAGEPLARFGSGPRSARAEELRARLAHAEAERDVLALLPLTPDPELTRRHQGVTQERSQAQQELGQAVIAAEVAARDLTAQLFAKTELLARLDSTLTERRKDLDRATVRSAHAQATLATFGKLAAKGAVSPVEHRDHEKTSREADVEAAALKDEVKNLLAEKGVLRGQVDQIEARRSDPADPLRRQVAALTGRVARLEAEEAALGAKLDGDRARAAELRRAEQAQAAAKVREHRAGVDGLDRELDVRAPFTGRVAYRAASPNAVRPGGALAAVAPENGFLLTARMGQSAADALQAGGEVTIEVADGSLERQVPARFRRAVSLPHEPGQAALQLDCQPPPDMVRRLADGEKLTVSFAWRPPLAAMWPFRAGVLLCAAGLAGLVAPGLYRARRRSRETTPPVTPAPPPGPDAGVTVTVADIALAPTIPDITLAPPAAALALVRPAGRPPAEAESPHLPAGAEPEDEAEEMPHTLEEVKACYRKSVAELNRAQSTRQAAGLLKRLRRLRGRQRSLETPAAPDRHAQIRHVLRSMQAPIKAKRSVGDAGPGAEGRS